MRTFYDEGGASILDAAIQVDRFKPLVERQRVDVDLEDPLGFDQDGCNYRARSARPIT